jgi:hypothetical protein
MTITNQQDLTLLRGQLDITREQMEVAAASVDQLSDEVDKYDELVPTLKAKCGSGFGVIHATLDHIAYHESTEKQVTLHIHLAEAKEKYRLLCLEEREIMLEIDKLLGL